MLDEEFHPLRLRTLALEREADEVRLDVAEEHMHLQNHPMVTAADELAAPEVVLEDADAALDPLVVEVEDALRRLARHELVREVVPRRVGHVADLPHPVPLLRLVNGSRQAGENISRMDAADGQPCRPSSL